jgi:hypothetical protein
LAWLIAAFGITRVLGAEQTLEKRIVPGTRWLASVTMDGSDYVSCQIEMETNSAQVRFTIGSKGSLVILISDSYLQAQISDVLGWTEGESYRSLLFLDDKSFNVQAQRLWEHTLLVPLPAIAKNTVFRTKKMALSVGQIAMRGYQIDGLEGEQRIGVVLSAVWAR